MKKLLRTFVFLLVIGFALHATFYTLTNMTAHEFFSYIFLDQTDEEELPVFIPFE